VSVAGQRLDTLNEDQLARFRREHVGIVFQSFHLVPTMTALENVALPLALLRRADAFDRAEAALDAVSLKHRSTTTGPALRRRTAARGACARHRSTEGSVRHEPTGNLDSWCGHRRSLVPLAGGAGATVPGDARTIPAARCDRILRMKDGLIVAEERHH
jgi:putative ABC transport system ATP-binding protein